MRVRKPWLSILASLALLVLLSAPGSAQTKPVTRSDIAQAAHFEEPLVPTAATTPEEDRALLTALAAHEQRGKSDDFTALSAFLAKYPRSGWAPALQTNLGLLYLHDGYFSRAIAAWQDAWEQGKSATGVEAKALVDRAFGELVQLEASLGHLDRVSALFKELGKRPIGGSATELVQTAAENVAQVGKEASHLFNCGPVALQALLLAKGVPAEQVAFLQWQKVGANGTSLVELGQMAAKPKPAFAYRLIQRKPGQQVPVPSVVHWKVGHYSAIVGESNGRFHVIDTMSRGADQWVTRDALDAEASGYFLVPADLAADRNWRTVPSAEAANIRGKGATIDERKGGDGDPPTSSPPPGPGDGGGGDGGGGDGGDGGKKPPCGEGMCRYEIKESGVSISLSDTPVGYTPPIGPSAKVRITYNQREDSQPANFTFFNVGQKWTLNWLSYVTDDPANPGASVSRYLSGGGAFFYSGYNGTTGQFTAQDVDGSILVRTSGPPVSYQRLLPDGSSEVYAQSDGSGSYPRKIFLTQIIDPQGNALTLAYDGQLRLTTATDAVGRQTTFAYGLAAHPLLVTQITDPFGRSATLTYDGSNRLSSITDVIGITSSVGYDANSLVNSLTTPYGTTTFSYTAPGTSAPPRFAQATDPMGFNEREEWLEPSPNPPTPDGDPAATVPTGMPYGLYDHYLNYRNSFHWDKDAYVAAGCTPTGGCDYTKARVRHFTHDPTNTTLKNTSLESVKEPLENRVWYTYPGQTGFSTNLIGGTSFKPTAIGRVLDDGTSQVRSFAYDTAGFFKVTQMVDPLGRTTNFTYPNHIDLTSVSQVTSGGSQTVAQYTYNSQHRPLTYTDAAGQTTNFAYNTAGQVTSVTNPLSQTTSFAYDANSNLSTITNANTQTAATYTYDSFARVRTFTDSEGWTVTYDYDAADRVTRKTYPDGTTDLYTYSNLDLVSHQDRQGRLWTYAYDANRRLTSVTDPGGAQTQYGYDHAGKLTSLTDPKSNTTNWTYDIEQRLIGKQYPDTSTLTYTYENTTSRLKSVTDALSQVRTYSYFKDDQLSGVTYTGAVHATPNVSFTYDPYFPRVVSMSDGTGTTQYTYVPVGTFGALLLQTEASPLASSTISYAYDALGRLSSRTVQGAGAESFTYDAIGRLTGHSHDMGAFTLAYLGQTGQITSRTLASSTLATAWSYLTNTGDRRLSGIANTGLTASQFSNFTYTTSPENFISATTETSDASPVYPAAGSQTATYNTLNQLTNLSGQALTFDTNGNLTSDGQRTYTWDAENRLVGITYLGVSGKATAFTYDGLSRRATISSTPPGGGSATVTSYLWCGSDICQARNASNTTTRSYYDEGEYSPGTPAQTLYYGIDQIGSVRRVFASMTSAAAYGYDPYGTPLQVTAPTTDFVYARMFYNADSGLYLTQHRAYDPTSGRWLSRDPIGERSDASANLYAYVAGNPVNHIDPIGLGPTAPSAPNLPPDPAPGSNANCDDSSNGALQQVADKPSKGAKDAPCAGPLSDCEKSEPDPKLRPRGIIKTPFGFLCRNCYNKNLGD